MPYHQLFYHIVWTTKGRLPLLTHEVRRSAHGFVRSKAAGLGGVIHALGGIEDHVHLVVSIPPSIAVSMFIGQIKGSTSTRLNRAGIVDGPFAWQAEYGVFTFDRKRLPNFVAYVQSQEEHHSSTTTIPVLERVGAAVKGSRISESALNYAPDQAAWLVEMAHLD